MPPDVAFQRLQRDGGDGRSALFNLCNCALGSGVLGFPAVYAQAGWLWATVFIGVFAALGIFSNSVMIRAASFYRVVSFQGVVREGLGVKVSEAAAAAMVVYSFGGCAAFLVIIRDFTVAPCEHTRAALGWELPEPGETDLCSQQVLLLLVSVIVVLPLSLRPTVTALSGAGGFAIAGICYLAFAVLFRALGAFLDRGSTLPPGVSSQAPLPSRVVYRGNLNGSPLVPQVQAIVLTRTGIVGPTGNDMKLAATSV